MRLKILSLLCLFIFQTSYASTLTVKNFLERPKLVVVLIIDQFRSDYLTRFPEEFIPAQQNGKLGGFQFLMQKSAYFPFGDYNILQSMTCPGHSMILTGSYPVMTGIPMNEWIDRKTKKEIYCVDDEKDGVSPRNLRTSTLSDEYLNAGFPSQIFSVALKDRSSVMLAGHRAEHVYWFDAKKTAWTSSTYYQKGIPQWVSEHNQKLDPNIKQVNAKPEGVSWTIDLAALAIEKLKLGQQKQTDFLFISLSTHDTVGHQFGPNSKEIKSITLHEDKEIARLLNILAKKVGMKNVVLVMTADHGVAPLVEDVVSKKLPAGRIDPAELIKKANAHLNAKYGGSASWFLDDVVTFNFYLNLEHINKKKISRIEIESEIKKVWLQETGVANVWSSYDRISNLALPPEPLAQSSRQLIESLSGDLVVIPRPFFYGKDAAPATHVTGYSYDRSVPIIIFGSKVKPGVYATPAKVVDIAPTLAFMLSILSPAANEGKVLSEIFN